MMGHVTWCGMMGAAVFTVMNESGRLGQNELLTLQNTDYTEGSVIVVSPLCVKSGEAVWRPLPPSCLFPPYRCNSLLLV